MVSKKSDYERIEATFSKSNPKEIELYNFALKEAELFGMAKYIKGLILKDMNEKKA